MRLRRLHRLLGLLLALPCVLWGLSGMILAWKNWARDTAPPPAPPPRMQAAARPFRVPVAAALAATLRPEPPRAVEWRHVLGAPRYLIRYAAAPAPLLVDGESGLLLTGTPAIDAALAGRIAEAEAPADTTVARVVLQTQPTLYYPRGFELPIYRVTLSSGDDIYVSPTTGDALPRVDGRFRLIRLAFYGLHVWRFVPGEAPYASYLVLMTAAGGLVLLGTTGGLLALRVARGRRRPGRELDPGRDQDLGAPAG